MVSAVQNTFSKEIENFLYKGVTEEQFTAFKEVLSKKTDEEQSDKAFLKSLSVQELYTILNAQGHTRRINIDTLTDEGAHNLLVTNKEDLVDLNNDGITEVGAATMFVFPPPNAPDEIKRGWKNLTSDMTEKEKFLATIPFFTAQSIANLRTMPDGSIQPIEIGDPAYRNAFEAGNQSYLDAIERAFWNCKNNPEMSAEEKEEKMAFLQRIRDAFEAEISI